jgi:hypothetical protein
LLGLFKISNFVFAVTAFFSCSAVILSSFSALTGNTLGMALPV